MRMQLSKLHYGCEWMVSLRQDMRDLPAQCLHNMHQWKKIIKQMARLHYTVVHLSRCRFHCVDFHRI